MKMYSYFVVFILTLAVVGSALLVGARPASAGLSCKGMVWGYGLSKSKPIARMKARQAWRANAGPGWNKYSLAKKRSHACRKRYHNGGHGAGGYKWNCVLKGRPCKKLGLSGG